MSKRSYYISKKSVTAKLLYPWLKMLLAVDIGVFVGSVFVLSFVYVSFLKRMVKTSSEVSKEKEESRKSHKEATD